MTENDVVARLLDHLDIDPMTVSEATKRAIRADLAHATEEVELDPGRLADLVRRNPW